jgi:hypothetical protein
MVSIRGSTLRPGFLVAAGKMRLRFEIFKSEDGRGLVLNVFAVDVVRPPKLMVSTGVSPPPPHLLLFPDEALIISSPLIPNLCRT